MLSNDHKAVLRALCRANDPPFLLEEIAATASVSFEHTWYVVLELIQLRLMTAVGIGFYGLTTEGIRTATELVGPTIPVR